MGIAAGPAGIVQRGGAVHPLRTLRQTDLLQNIPDSDDLSADGFRQLLAAAGAACDNHRVPKFGELRQQELSRALLHLEAPGPVTDRPAAAQHQRHPSVQAAAEVEIGGLHRLRCDRRGLTSREEDIPAGFTARLRPAEEGVGVRKQHVHQRKLMRRQGHLVC